MEIFTLLENLEELVENGTKVPLSSKVLVDKDELSEILEEIRMKLPDELKQAKWVKEERQRIIMDAQKEADQIVKETETKIISLVDDHEITRQALAQKEEIIESADRVAREISEGTRQYADALLGRLEEILKETLNVIHDNRKELK
ncbi:MAG: ATPase [Clostridia bacterium]|nr:ATPase [Clostridia bacterium]MBR6641125.1 ATPase [Clostridia bacterium]MBR6689668.1 ATPase [Clostridia bacterium]